MTQKIDRRSAIKVVAAGAIATSSSTSHHAPASAAQPALKATGAAKAVAGWSNTHDRVWLGEAYWANPMEDWRIIDGAAECQNLAGNRSVHCLTHQITRPLSGFSMHVQLQRVERKRADGGAGFRVGVRSELNEYRSNCFAAGGLNAGIVGGELRLGPKRAPLPGDRAVEQGVVLRLRGQAAGEQLRLTLSATSHDGQALGELTHTVAPDATLGNVAIVDNYSPSNRRRGKPQGKQPQTLGQSRYRFREWMLEGDAFQVRPEQAFGPLLWSMYTLSDSRTDEGFVMKLSALTGPLGEQDNRYVELYVQRDGEWRSLGEAELDRDAWVATFRAPRWDAREAVPFKLVYREHHRDGSSTTHERTGTIRANPVGRLLRMGALTCQNDYGFPYEPVANNVKRLDPDLVYFSGDQIYESHGGFGIIRSPAEPAILNYLRKYYQFGWAFGDVMRDRPTLCLPDDHDVFQGNIWGEGGAKMDVGDTGASSKGGYVEPARMVNVVHRTNVAHHPDPFDPKPSKQDISVYYGDMVYGNVSFAIIADRQWKSGPERVETGSGRADHVSDPDFDTSKLDKPGLVLLGERQEAFLRQWAEDWRGHALKAVLSQTVFAGVATHHGSYDGYLKADLDCGSWPQAARNRAVEILRPAMALHINGDQHLTTLCQYGSRRQREGSWAFCTPAISAGYPRWWRPDEVGMEHARRPQHNLPNTGEFVDGFGNLVYVYAVGNPVVGQAKNRYERAHEKGSGFGLVTFDTEKKTYLIESFRFLIDATDGKAENQFPGWPVTIQQKENRGDNELE